MPSGKELFLILDPGFENAIGHHYDYNKAIAQAIENSYDYEVRVLSYRKANLEDRSLNVDRVFTKSYYRPPIVNLNGKIAIALSILLANYYFLKDIFLYFKKRRIKSCSLFIHTLCHEQFMGLIMFLLYAKIKKIFIKRAVMLWRISYERFHLKGIRIIPRIVFRFFDIFFANSPNIIISTDTMDLKKEYESYTKHKVEVFPIPHTVREYSQHVEDPIKKSLNGSNSRVVYTFLGDARREKGFHLIFPAVNLIQEFCKKNKIFFWLQSYMTVYARKDPLMIETLNDFRKSRFDFVSLYDSPLTSEQYANCLYSSDVVLIPYIAEDYKNRSSGILAEALSIGKFVIVPKNTWMEECIVEGVNGVSFKSGDYHELSQAIVRSYYLYNKHIKERELLKQKWNKFHNPFTMVKKIFR